MEFKEIAGFSKIIGDVLTDEEYSGLQAALMADPEKGDLIQGTGGARKIRVAAKGHGKRGGARVIYYFQVAHTIHFLGVYPKSEKADLSERDRKNITGIIQAIKENRL